MIPEWLHNKRIGVFDLETDRIPTTEIFCNSIAFIDIDSNGEAKVTSSKVYTQYWTPYSNGSLMESITLLNECDYICGHNIINFDCKEVNKHLGIKLKAKPLDTLILSKIIFSKDDLYVVDPQLGIDKDLYGSYSLKAFGQRLGDFKIEFHEFNSLTEEMAIYCNQDVDLTAKLLLFLLEKENFPIEKVVTIEHKAAAIIAEQEDNGFYIDIEMTRKLNTKLLQEKGELARELSSIFSPKFLKDGPVKTYNKLSKVKKYLPNNNYIPLLGTK